MRWVVPVLLIGCGRIGFDPHSSDAPPACTLGDFGAPVRLAGPVNSSSDDWNGTPARGGLDLFMHSFRAGGQAAAPWEARRASTSDPFDTPVLIAELDTAGMDAEPTPTEDGLTLVFVRVGGATLSDLYQAQRPALDQPFGAPVALSVDTANAEEGPWLSADGLRLIFASARGGTGMLDLYETTRTSLTAPFDPPRELSELNSPQNEATGSLSPDGLEIFFGSIRAGGLGGQDIYTARRPALDQPFGAPTRLTQLSTPIDDVSPRIASDNVTLYLNYDTQTAGGANADVWISTRPCL